MDNGHPFLGAAGHASAILATVLAWAAVLPPLTALVALGWYCVLFWDRFVKPWLARRRAQRAASQPRP